MIWRFSGMFNLFNPQTLQNLCKKYHLSPSKKYGQNYLIDPTVIDTILTAAEVSAEDTIVEVGPGFGVLTESLASRVQKVFAFEIEKKLVPYWEGRKKDLPNVEIVWGNVLHEVERQKSIKSVKSYKVVANLPYQITSPVIRLFLEAEFPPRMMVLMVQKEVAERICAMPGEMSLLSVAVQYYADVQYVKTVPRSAFWPIPGVDSAVIKLVLKLPLAPSCKEGEKLCPPSVKRELGGVVAKEFFKVVKIGFANRRKVLRKNLEQGLGKEKRNSIEQAFESLGLSSEVRAQELSVEAWVKLMLHVYG